MNNIEELLEIMARLRDPEGGCPWDLAQCFETLIPYTLEEAYEVTEAIGQGDLVALRGELGDLLFQVVFYARLAEEQGVFDFGQVVAGIITKLIYPWRYRFRRQLQALFIPCWRGLQGCRSGA